MYPNKQKSPFDIPSASRFIKLFGVTGGGGGIGITAGGRPIPIPIPLLIEAGELHALGVRLQEEAAGRLPYSTQA